jgi:hypothetical protein
MGSNRLQYFRFAGGSSRPSGMPSDYSNMNPDAFHTYTAVDEDGKVHSTADVSHWAGNSYPQMYTGGSYNDHLVADSEQTQDKGYVPYDGKSHRDAEENEQLIMFGIKHNPPSRKIEGLYSRETPTGKISAMNLLGMIDNASRETIKRGVLPSNSLSEYSLPLVQRLKDSGAIDRDISIPSKGNNGVTFDDADYHLDAMQGKPVRPGEINITHRLPHARARIREAMGRPVPTIEPKNEQLQLEGFE